MIAEKKERSGSRFYPCPRCKQEHPSSTTLLGMISSKALTSWAAKNGTAKLNMFADIVKNIDDEVWQKASDAAQEEWECKEDTMFWKSGKQIGQDAADMGTLAHSWIEAHLHKKDVTLISLPDPAKRAVEGFLAWEKAHKVEVLETEKTLYNCNLGYAGTCDCIAHVDGELTLLDWKTSNGIYSSYPIQCWSYALAHEMQDGSHLYRQVGIGRFGKLGDWEVRLFKRNAYDGIETARRIIEGCAAIFKFQSEWEFNHPWKSKKKEADNGLSGKSQGPNDEPKRAL